MFDSITSESAKPTNHAFIRSKDHSWIPAIVTTNDGKHAEVKVPQYKSQQAIKCDAGATAIKGFVKQRIDLSDYPNNALPMQNVNEQGLMEEIPDMVHMPFLHEAGILYNLKARHSLGKPYTRAGDVVMAVNPYQWMMEYYSHKRMNQYSDVLVWDFENAVKVDPRKHLEPHVYEVSALAYRGLAIKGEDQSILVSGESGAGKTETVKICLNHIASIQQGPIHKSNVTSVAPIVQNILDSNPLLEAFGNAKTRRNDNSSRFGKYIQLQFDTEHAAKSDKSPVPVCALAGSKCETYLLEKCRVVAHDPEERTFHIFYQLLAAPDRIKSKIWEGLVGNTKESYSYVGWSETDKIEGISDAARWNETIDSLSLVGIQGSQLKSLMQAICVVLQLGNVTFQADPSDSDRCVITNYHDMESLAGLMGISGNELQNALTLRHMSIKGETCNVPLSAAKAKESCDAFAKEIYSKTFLWLVRIINDSTCAEKNFSTGNVGTFGMIGLLDIFGFECFDQNHFEQLCINYANEKLQQKFNNDMFKAVQAEYELEGVPLDEIKYDDNAHVVQLIEGRMGLLDFLNEECYRPQGSDEAFVQKAILQNKSNSCLIKPKNSRRVDFGIHHYARDVMYDASNFVTTNMDTLPTDLQVLACKSTNPIIAKELTNGNTTNATSKVRPGQRGPSNIVAPTVWTKYKNQLVDLMTSLHNTQSRYIRCIKPNDEKKPLVMEHQSTIEQLRCAGVIAAITISRSAFPNRMDQKQALGRFKRMWPKGEGPTAHDDSNEARRSDCERLLTSALKHMEQLENGRASKAFVLGNNKVYFRSGALEHLEAERLKNADEWAREEAEEEQRIEEERQRIEEERKRQERLQMEALQRKEEEARLQEERAAEASRVEAKKVAEQARLRAEREAVEERLQQERELAIQRAAEEEAERARRKEAAFQERIRRKAANKRRAALELQRAAEQEHRERELSNLWSQIKEMQARLIEAQKRRKADLEAAEQRRAKEVEQRRELLEEERRALEEVRSGQLPPAQESIINESSKIIEYLHRENARLSAVNKKAIDDVNHLKKNQERLTESNEKAREALSSLSDNAKHQNDVHLKLRNNEQVYRQQMTLLKGELKTRERYYKTESQMLLIFQRGLTEMVDTLHDQCTQNDVIEEAVKTEEVIDAKAKSNLIGFELDGFSSNPQKLPYPSSAPDVTETEASESEYDDEFVDEEEEDTGAVAVRA